MCLVYLSACPRGHWFIWETVVISLEPSAYQQAILSAFQYGSFVCMVMKSSEGCTSSGPLLPQGVNDYHYIVMIIARVT